MRGVVRDSQGRGLFFRSVSSLELGPMHSCQKCSPRSLKRKATRGAGPALHELQSAAGLRFGVVVDHWKRYFHPHSSFTEGLL